MFNNIENKSFNTIFFLKNTVKPVYDGHLWGLKNVVVMQRVVWKKSVVNKLQAGRYIFILANVDRWPLFGGGC